MKGCSENGSDDSSEEQGGACGAVHDEVEERPVGDEGVAGRDAVAKHFGDGGALSAGFRYLDQTLMDDTLERCHLRGCHIGKVGLGGVE